MISHLTEAKPQCWRALAVLADRGERLLYLGRSSEKVRAGYVSAFLDLLDEEEREQVENIQLQRWNGAPDAGRWQMQTTLTIPNRAKLLKVA